MARSLRLEFSGALYHVTSRGDRQENIFETDEDRHQFLTLVRRCLLSPQLAMPLREIESQSNSRDDAILKMYKTRHYTLKQIGDYFGLRCSRISRIVAKGKTRPL